MLDWKEVLEFVRESRIRALDIPARGLNVIWRNAPFHLYFDEEGALRMVQL